MQTVSHGEGALDLSSTHLVETLTFTVQREPNPQDEDRRQRRGRHPRRKPQVLPCKPSPGLGAITDSSTWKRRPPRCRRSKNVKVKVHLVLQFHTRTDVTVSCALPPPRDGLLCEDRDVWQTGHCDLHAGPATTGPGERLPTAFKPQTQDLLQGEPGDPCHLPLPPQDTPSALHGLTSAPAPLHSWALSLPPVPTNMSPGLHRCLAQRKLH